MSPVRPIVQLLMYLIPRSPPHIPERVLPVFFPVCMSAERLRSRLAGLSSSLEATYCLGLPNFGSGMVPVESLHNPNPHPFGDECINCCLIVSRDPFCQLLQSPPPMFDSVVSLLPPLFCALCRSLFRLSRNCTTNVRTMAPVCLLRFSITTGCRLIA